MLCVAVTLRVLLEHIEVAQVPGLQACGVSVCTCPPHLLSCGPEKLRESLLSSLGILVWSLGSLPVEG